MSVISTSLHTISNVVKHEYGADYAYCKKLVTVNDTAGTLAIGTVLGKVTADGKFKRAVQTAVDGSAVAAAIVAAAKTIAGTTDTQVLVYFRGPMGVSKNGLVLDATYDTAAEKAAVYASLEDLGIQCLDTI
jgi:hypothetical protein